MEGADTGGRMPRALEVKKRDKPLTAACDKCLNCVNPGEGMHETLSHHKRGSYSGMSWVPVYPHRVAK